MLFYLPFLFLFYVILTGILYIAWEKIPVYISSGKTPATRLSVLIAVRNEEKGIEMLLKDLERQTYPKNLFEVLILDDHSEDDTTNVVRAYQ
jgi:cellulose synthase/poly-beta-1,6-N-acetylglucosamine synthase-like glycosyltransferase